MRILVWVILALTTLPSRAQWPAEPQGEILQRDTFTDRKGRIGVRYTYLVQKNDNDREMDTFVCYHYRRSILDIADSLAEVYGVPSELVYEIGMNESRWPNIHDLDHLIRNGDLQVMEGAFNILCRRLGIEPVKNRYNYLLCGISYLRQCYDRYGSWEKARYAYGRGHWKEPQYWTSLEKRFMGKIDWSKYDYPEDFFEEYEQR